MMSRLAWYRKAAQSLGLASLARRQIQRRFGLTDTLCRLTAKHLAHPVYARLNSSDFVVFDQIFIELQYKCLDHVERPELIIDCGANVGYSSAYFLSRFPSCQVIAVEPDPENFRILLKNMAPYGDRCLALQAAIWPKEDALRLNKPSGPNEEWGISVEKSGPATANVKAVTVPMLMERVAKNRISILKIDIEGAEFELFRENLDWLAQVDNIVIELHDEQCKKAFFAAVRGRGFAISQSGELTVCLQAAR